MDILSLRLHDHTKFCAMVFFAMEIQSPMGLVQTTVASYVRLGSQMGWRVERVRKDECTVE
jgi:hypothetical protein